MAASSAASSRGAAALNALAIIVSVLSYCVAWGAALEVRRLTDAVRFRPIEAGINEIEVFADFVRGSFVLRGESDPNLDIAMLGEPWRRTLEQLTGGLGVVESVHDDVQQVTDSSKTHYITVRYRVLPLDGQVSKVQRLLAEYQELDSAVWDVLISHCAECATFVTDGAWKLAKETEAIVSTDTLVYPGWFGGPGSGTTTTMSTGQGTTLSPSGDSGSGSSSGSAIGDGPGGHHWTVPATTAAPITTGDCGRPAVVGFTVASARHATFVFCEPVVHRAGQVVSFVILRNATAGAEQSPRTEIPINQTSFESGNTLVVDILGFAQPGDHFRLVLREGAVAGVGGALSLFYESAVFTSPLAATDPMLIEEEDSSWTAMGAFSWRVILTSAAVTVGCCLCCILCWRWLLASPPDSENVLGSRGRNLMYLRSMSFKLTKRSRVQPDVDPATRGSLVTARIVVCPPLQPDAELGGCHEIGQLSARSSLKQSPRTVVSPPLPPYAALGGCHGIGHLSARSSLKQSPRTIACPPLQPDAEFARCQGSGQLSARSSLKQSPRSVVSQASTRRPRSEISSSPRSSISSSCSASRRLSHQSRLSVPPSTSVSPMPAAGGSHFSTPRSARSSPRQS